MKKLFFNCLMIAIFFVFPLPGDGEEAFFQQGKYAIDDIVTALAPAPTSKTYKTRDIGSAVKIQKRAISLAIHFQKNSYNLTPEAENTLNVLGKALNKERLKEFKFIIQGHTDASGSDQYNLLLSNQRSETVKNFLVTKHDVDLNRLVAEGKGETEPCDKSNPYSGVNRRVKIINNGR